VLTMHRERLLSLPSRPIVLGTESDQIRAPRSRIQIAVAQLDPRRFVEANVEVADVGQGPPHLPCLALVAAGIEPDQIVIDHNPNLIIGDGVDPAIGHPHLAGGLPGIEFRQHPPPLAGGIVGGRDRVGFRAGHEILRDIGLAFLAPARRLHPTIMTADHDNVFIAIVQTRGHKHTVFAGAVLNGRAMVGPLQATVRAVPDLRSPLAHPMIGVRPQQTHDVAVRQQGQGGPTTGVVDGHISFIQFAGVGLGRSGGSAQQEHHKDGIEISFH